ncbi:MAG: DUF58 domain-containing protein, partial [Acidimicrobiales bacterium]|nr:DUF58 domain-containing protein [Acidimicrobiales bacterium]
MAVSDEPGRLRRRLTGVGVAAAMLAGLSALLWLASDADAHLALAVTVAVALVVEVVLAHRAVRPVAVDLRPPGHVTAGRPSRWRLQVHGWSRPVEIRPQLLPGARAHVAHDPRAGTVEVPALGRGPVSLAVVDVVATGPIGLVTAGRRLLVHFPTPMLVVPEPVPVEVRWPTPRAHRFGLSEGAPRGDDLFRTVRPYQPGDGRRRVHWQATAHHGELMVRESDGTGVVTVRVIAELGVPGAEADRVAGVACTVV